jgi:hypothetical protein
VSINTHTLACRCPRDSTVARWRRSGWTSDVPVRLTERNPPRRRPGISFLRTDGKKNSQKSVPWNNYYIKVSIESTFENRCHGLWPRCSGDDNLDEENLYTHTHTHTHSLTHSLTSGEDNLDEENLYHTQTQTHTDTNVVITQTSAPYHNHTYTHVRTHAHTHLCKDPAKELVDKHEGLEFKY